MNKEKNFISAVVYLCDNAGNISNFLRAINGLLSDNFLNYELIIVNDASRDDGVDVVRRFVKDVKGCTASIVNFSCFQGIEASMTAGVDLSIGDFVFEFDSSFIDYDLSVVMDVYRRALSGYDIVAAANGRKRFASGLFYSLYNANVKQQHKLAAETFRILSRRAINRINSMSKTIPYRKAVYANCGLKIDRIVYQPKNSEGQRSSFVTYSDRSDTALTTLVTFTNVAYRASAFLMIAMMTVTILAAIYVIYYYLSNQPVPGYTTTMLLMCGLFFGVFSILFIIVKYLSVILDLTFRKNKYVIESIEKISSD